MYEGKYFHNKSTVCSSNHLNYPTLCESDNVLKQNLSFIEVQRFACMCKETRN